MATYVILMVWSHVWASSGKPYSGHWGAVILCRMLAECKCLVWARAGPDQFCYVGCGALGQIADAINYTELLSLHVSKTWSPDGNRNISLVAIGGETEPVAFGMICWLQKRYRCLCSTQTSLFHCDLRTDFNNAVQAVSAFYWDCETSRWKKNSWDAQ